MSASSDPIGWLLLRDGHAVPLHGLAPEDLKRSKKEAIWIPDRKPGHVLGLTALIDTLGFRGNWSDYGSSHWPRVQAFMAEHGLGQRADLFERHIDSLDLFMRRDPTRRALADRLFAGGGNLPTRAFTGHDFDFSPYTMEAMKPQQMWFMGDQAFEPDDRSTAEEMVYRNRLKLNGGHNYMGDQLLDGLTGGDLVVTLYRATETEWSRVKKTWAVFRWIIEQDGAGWVEVLPYNDHLIFLRAADGSWDLVWRDLRAAPPTEEIPAAGWGGMPPQHQPSWLAAEPQFKRALYMRRGHWEEKVLHDAETRYYDRGGEAGDAYPGTDELVRRFLVEEGVNVAPAASVLPRQTEHLPAGFSRIRMPSGTDLGISPLVTVADFVAMAEKTGWLRDRKGEDLRKANPGATALPAGVTWHDAVACCAWMERKLGAQVRLLTREEHRALRPFPSKHYENMAQGDFPWENWPPRHGLQPAVVWSEPRFLEPSPDRPEFPASSSGIVVGGKSRKRWITDFPPTADWAEAIPWANHMGLVFIDAWDAYEWVTGPWNSGYTAGRYWDGQIGLDSWGAYKNCKIGFRVVVELTNDPSTT